MVKALCLSLALSLPTFLQGAVPVLTFAFTGDMRVDPEHGGASFKPLSPAYLDPAYLKEAGKPIQQDHYPFAFNYGQTRQNLMDLLNLLPAHPTFRYFFITGDLVMGFKRNGEALPKELEDFSTLLDQPIFRKLRERCMVLPMPGNHETTFKEFISGKAVSGADTGGEEKYIAWVKEHNLLPSGHHFKGAPGANQPLTAEGKPKSANDMSVDNYSFEDGPVHFLVLDTDTPTDELTEPGDSHAPHYRTLGLFPLSWAQHDLRAAQADPNIKHIFIFTHKPIAYPINFPSPGRTEAMDPQVGKPFLDTVLECDKVDLVCCSHCHEEAVQSLSEPGTLKPPLQITAGNAGQQPEHFWHPENEGNRYSWLPGEKQGPFYGFILVTVYNTGEVDFNSYQRPVGSPFYASDANHPVLPARARLQDTVAVKDFAHRHEAAHHVVTH